MSLTDEKNGDIREIFKQYQESAGENVSLNVVDGPSCKASLADFAVTNPEKVRGRYDSLLVVYNMVVIIMTGFAILLSVFVLSNLTNIFVAGKKKELIVMRVNGFSTKQNLGYLARETILITALGFILAVVAGGIAGYFMLRVMEHDDAMLVRDFNPKAWLIAILMEFAFAGIIDAIAFRSVKKLKVTDINS